MEKKPLVVTFTCNNHVHVYSNKSGVKPMPPYKIHNSVEKALEYLTKTRSLARPKVLHK